MAPVYNGTIRVSLRGGTASGALITKDTSFSHSLTSAFPRCGSISSVPVIFDFRGIDDSRPPDAFRDTLWCLLPGRAEGSAVVVGMSREEFVKVAPSRPQLLPAQDIVAGFAHRIRELRAQENALEARRFAGMPGGGISRRRYPRF
jgi:hypothetical protein